MEHSLTLTVQLFIAVNRNLLSRANLLVNQDLKDEQVFKVLEESDKEADLLRQNILVLQEENKMLKAKVNTSSRKNPNRTFSNHNTSKGSIHPKFTLDEENGTISEIRGGEVGPCM